MDVLCGLSKENMIRNKIENFKTNESAPNDLRSCSSSDISILLCCYLIDVSPHGNARFIRTTHAKSTIADFINDRDFNGQKIYLMERREFGRQISTGIGQKNTNGVFVGLYDYMKRCALIFIPPSIPIPSTENHPSLKLDVVYFIVFVIFNGRKS